jgi:hypothetical protein
MPDTKHIIYSAEDIHRYFSGKMNASEMHAMEKASLEDALLAEAMEGYQQCASFANDAGFAAMQKQLDALKENIAGKTVGTKKYNNWWKVLSLHFLNYLMLIINKRQLLQKKIILLKPRMLL